MFIIKVKSNYGQHEGGRVILRRPQDPPFEIDPDKGQELICLLYTSDAADE